MTWPLPDTKEMRSLERDAIAYAAMLGAVFGELEPGWSKGERLFNKWYVENYRAAVGLHPTQGKAAVAFLLAKNINLAYNHGTDQWEVVRL